MHFFSYIIRFFYEETATKENKMIVSSNYMILTKVAIGNVYNRSLWPTKTHSKYC